MNNNIENIKNSLNQDLCQFQEAQNDLLNLNKNQKSQIDNVNISNLKDSVLSNAVLNIVIQLGMIKVKIQDLLKIMPGQILNLNKKNCEVLDILVNNILIAKGELVRLKDKYGIRITKIINSCD